jgi:hypothetical protein
MLHPSFINFVKKQRPLLRSLEFQTGMQNSAQGRAQKEGTHFWTVKSSVRRKIREPQIVIRHTGRSPDFDHRRLFSSQAKAQ